MHNIIYTKVTSIKNIVLKSVTFFKHRLPYKKLFL